MLFLKIIASRLPTRWQEDLRRLHFRRQIGRGEFTSPEPEFTALPNLVRQGDWAIDVGANVGHYTKRLSELVGPVGRVIAFEPVPATFALLASNARYFSYQNVTLINAAASGIPSVVRMRVPSSDTGLSNYYQAEIVDGSQPDSHELEALTLRIDDLRLSGRVRLVKIDAEGHEENVFRGVIGLVDRDRPILIIEGRSAAIESELRAKRYSVERLPGSPNTLFRPADAD